MIAVADSVSLVYVAEIESRLCRLPPGTRKTRHTLSTYICSCVPAYQSPTSALSRPIR